MKLYNRAKQKCVSCLLNHSNEKYTCWNCGTCSSSNCVPLNMTILKMSVVHILREANELKNKTISDNLIRYETVQNEKREKNGRVIKGSQQTNTRPERRVEKERLNYRYID